MTFKPMGLKFWGLLALVPLLAITLGLFGTALPVQANPHPGQSQRVVIIGGATLDLNNPCQDGGTPEANVMGATLGGCLPVIGTPGELQDFIFTPMLPAAVNAVSLAPFDTAVLNVASAAMACDTGNLTPTAQADLVAFVGAGKKLIIYDSECAPDPVDYNWLPFPFTTSNPGSTGQQTGTLTIVEQNTLGTSTSSDPHFINTADLTANTDAVGDMNVMRTFDQNWCLHMTGTNVNGDSGPVHTYARFGSPGRVGLIIYNGLDQDYQQFGLGPNPNLRKMWVQELQQPFNPDGLPCAFPVVGIRLDPQTDENLPGTQHTVTATVTDLGGNRVPGVLVTFSVISGPNTGAPGVCNPPSCQTGANGQVSFTYQSNGQTGTDTIRACFTDADGNPHCATATKDWVIGPPASLVLAPKTAQNTVGTQHCVTATVRDAVGNPVPGVIVRFTVTGPGSTSGSATTNAGGVATFCYTTTTPGADVIRAYADTDRDNTQDPGEPFDVASKTWVAGAPATLTLAPKTATNPVDTQHCVTATVKDVFGNPVPGVTVRFKVSGSVNTGGSATTNASGQAQFCYTGPALPGADTITAYADTNNNNVQDPGEPSDTATKTWVTPVGAAEGCKVTYGGRITAANKDKATVGGNAQAPNKGQEEYQDHGPAQPRNVHSINVTSVTCSPDKTQASIFGQATINGAGTFNYRIDVKDLGKTGTYRIRLSDGYDSGEQTLEGGNVQIQK
jgi:hypothetical protein